MIPRFYDVTSGAIRINGQDIRDLTLESLRRHIALVSQDITIFNDSVFENIRYGNPQASSEAVYEAAKAAAAHDFILGLEEGYDTVVGENGVKLSGGAEAKNFQLPGQSYVMRRSCFWMRRRLRWTMNRSILFRKLLKPCKKGARLSLLLTA